MFCWEDRKAQRKKILDAAQTNLRSASTRYSDLELANLIFIFHVFLFFLFCYLYIYHPATRIYILILFILVILFNLYFHGCLISMLEVRLGRTYLITDAPLDFLGIERNNHNRYNFTIVFFILAMLLALYIYFYY